MIVVTAIIVIAVAAIGTLFLGGASPAVASAGRDVGAAFDEARRTAIAFDAATVVFAPAQSGRGYRARIYARMPGDPAFAARTGPTYDSTVAISETAVPLGAPGFAFAIDSQGTVTGFANFVVGQSNGTSHPCPASGAFALLLVDASDVRTVVIPCQLPLSSTTPVVFETPPQVPPSLPFPIATCPSSETCTLALITPPSASCALGYTADPTTPGICDVAVTPAPIAAATCPPGFAGQPPDCTAPATPPSTLPTPIAAATCPPGFAGQPPDCTVPATPMPTLTPVPAPTAQPRCIAGLPDALGFSSCLESNPIHITGGPITRQSCGTHTPINDPGTSFVVAVDIWKDGAPWGSYSIEVTELKAPWFDLAYDPPVPACGLEYTLAFSIAGATPESGNAASTPWQDTHDPAFVHDGIDAILVAPAGAWGSDR